MPPRQQQLLRLPQQQSPNLPLPLLRLPQLLPHRRPHSQGMQQAIPHQPQGSSWTRRA